ncbi:MAG: hypothetical protein OEU54_02155 [Gemmatimonadota bacterium]|nr:hypothetical protein [Gemmatimonadota bacterium]
MGYVVYITRARHQLEGPQTPIPQEDWRVVIENDPDLRAAGETPDLAHWAGPARVRDPSIDWANGNLFSRDPDHSVIRKLIDIAGLLGGRVQGDRGELYSIERGRVISDEPPADLASAAAVPDSVSLSEPFQGVEPLATGGLEGAMGEEELDAALGALATHNEAVLDDVSRSAPAPEDPNASFARPPEDALGQDPAGQAPGPIPFVVGQRVQTPWGRPGTIVSIDPDADWGMGHIEIKYDDGRTATTSCIAHGLEPM